MQIAYDYLIFISQKYGGVSRYFYELIKRLENEKQYNVHLYSGMHINEYIKYLSRNKIRNIGFSFPNSKYKIRSVLSSLITSVRTIEAEIYHTTYYYMSPLNRKKFSVNICTAYDMIHEKYSDCFQNAKDTTLLKEKAFHSSDKIICISESTKKDLIQFFNVPESKIKVIYLGSEFPISLNETPKVDYPYILYTGQRLNYKNFINFVKAYSINTFLKNSFSIITFGGGKFNEEEHELIQSLGISNKIINMNGNDKLLANLYANASLFVYPSLYEGFGLPPLEAMRNNCIVAVSNCSSIPEVVGKAGVYFDPLSIEDMSQKMEQALTDSAIRRYLLNKSLDQIRKFSWDACYNQTMDLYKSFIM